MICCKLFVGNGASSSRSSSCVAFIMIFMVLVATRPSFYEDLFWFLNQLKINILGILCSNYIMKN